MKVPTPLGWLGIARLGLVQTALGAIVVLTTSTMNRVMVVELALPAMLPGALVALHYGLQVLRPRLGHGSDVGGRRTPWILGGMLVLAIGGVGAAAATALMATNLAAGILLAVLAFCMIGVGVGACGTSLLVLLATLVDDRRRAAAATVVWVMMIAGIVVTATVAGHFLDPFSTTRLVAVTAVVCAAALLLTVLAILGVEAAEAPVRPAPEEVPFRVALRQVWSEPQARRFAIFVFVSMLAYSAQDLILEPYAGLVFGLTPGETTKLSGLQNAGVLCGMVLVAVAGTLAGGRRAASLQRWTVGGCVASALALFALVVAASVGPGWPLRGSVFALGLANGAYAVAAIGSMMALVGAGAQGRQGVRMGLWGAAQAIAFGAGGLVGTIGADLARWTLGSPAASYALVFAAEGVLFLVAAFLALRLDRPAASSTTISQIAGGRVAVGGSIAS